MTVTRTYLTFAINEKILIDNRTLLPSLESKDFSSQIITFCLFLSEWVCFLRTEFETNMTLIRQIHDIFPMVDVVVCIHSLLWHFVDQSRSGIIYLIGDVVLAKNLNINSQNCEREIQFCESRRLSWRERRDVNGNNFEANLCVRNAS